MLRKFEYTDILGWSVSRYDTFTTCQRQYYYQYYGKYDTDPGNTLLRLNVLKNLTTIPLEIGNISHKIIEILLDRLKKSSDEIDREKFKKFVRDKTAAIALTKNFFEVYYREKDAVDHETEILPFVETALENFLASERFAWIREKALAQSGEWIIEPEGFGECRIDGLKAFCKVDFLFPVGKNIYIIDWKTGKEAKPKFDERHDKHSRQMRGYVVWAHFQMEKNYEDIFPTIAYLLPDYKERNVRLTEFDMEDFADSIRTETEEMYKYCADVEFNIPREKEFFEMTKNINTCRFCNFRELCGK